MSSQAITYVSPEEYLERERLAETKHEYIDGEIVAMAGGSPEHALIIMNVGGALVARPHGAPRHDDQVAIDRLRASGGRDLRSRNFQVEP